VVSGELTEAEAEGRTLVTRFTAGTRHYTTTLYFTPMTPLTLTHFLYLLCITYIIIYIVQVQESGEEELELELDKNKREKKTGNGDGLLAKQI